MDDMENTDKSFRLANQYANYRFEKAWGMWLILTSVMIAIFSFLSIFGSIITQLRINDLSDLIIDFLYSIFLYSIAFLVVWLSFFTYLKTKRTVIENYTIKARRYFLLIVLFSIMIIFGYFFPLLMSARILILKYINPYSSVFFYVCIDFLGKMVSFVFAYLLLRLLNSQQKHNELLQVSLVLLGIAGVFLLIDLIYPVLVPNTFPDSLFTILVKTFAILLASACYVSCGYFTLLRATKILEGENVSG